MAILKCDCENKWMDAQYGKGMRVHNPRKPGTDGIATMGYTCIVCGNERGG